MIEAIYTKGSEKLEEIINIVKACESDFIDLNRTVNEKQYSNNTYNVIVYDDKKAVATGRLRTNPEYLIDQVIVLINYRKQYYGDLVVKMLLDKGFNLGADEILAFTPKKALKFFEKIGFYEIEHNINTELLTIGIKSSNLKKCIH